MEEKINRVLAVTESMNRRLETSGTVFRRSLRYGERLIIPIMLGLLAFVANNASNRISESQLKLAEEESARRVTEFQAQIQVELLKIFYRDITSGDSTKQTDAILLLQSMDDKLATTFAGFVERKSSIPPEIRSQATQIRRSIETLAPLSGYKIGIYPLPASVELKSLALDISDKFRQKGFKGNIQIYDKDISFFHKVVMPNGYEIRYEQGDEDDQADLMQSLLEEFYPGEQFKKQTVTNRTRGFISIFLSIPESRRAEPEAVLRDS